MLSNLARYLVLIGVVKLHLIDQWNRKGLIDQIHLVWHDLSKLRTHRHGNWDQKNSKYVRKCQPYGSPCRFNHAMDVQKSDVCILYIIRFASFFDFFIKFQMNSIRLYIGTSATSFISDKRR